MTCMLQLRDLSESDVRAAMVQLWAAEWAELEGSPDHRACYGKWLSDGGWAAYAAY